MYEIRNLRIRLKKNRSSVIMAEIFTALWDVGADQGITLRAHQYNTNCVSFSKVDSSKFYSTSLDGSTRTGDVNTSTLTMVC
mgnify:CR=1 FL=1